MSKREVVYKNLVDIQPYEKNPRKNDKSVEFVANSIREFGFNVPIVVDGDGVIVAGHTRYRASKKLGLEEVPVIVVDDLSEEQVTAFRLADNKVGETSEWDNIKLNAELEKLFGEIDMSKFGFPVQIENIDEDLIGEEKIGVELGEANNYVVLQFYTVSEWEDAMNILGLETVATNESNPRIRRHGIGRVIDGKPIIEKLKR